MCGALLPLPRLRPRGAHSDKFTIKQFAVADSAEKKNRKSIDGRSIDTDTLKAWPLKATPIFKNAFH
jgi:hypothetical protein